MGLEIGTKEKKWDGVRVTLGRFILKYENKFFQYAMFYLKLGSKLLKTLASGRISIGALSIGTATGAYEKALKYSKHRIAFNNPINHFQSISFKLADMATKNRSIKAACISCCLVKRSR